MVARGLDKNKKEHIKINFLPFIESDVFEWFTNQTNLTNKSIESILNGILNEKLVNVILRKSGIDGNKRFNELNEFEKNKVVKNCTSFGVNVLSTNSFDKAQVCSGGIPLDEIDLNTMESKIVKNLYIIGELLDITGDCGGYNLGIAWRTGFLAGSSVKRH